MIIESSTRFDKYTNSFDDLINVCPTLRAKREAKDVEMLINDIISSSDYITNKTFIYAPKGLFFKVSYSYYKEIKEIVNSPKYKDKFKTTDKGGGKIVVSYINGGIIFETGAGSIGRITTAQQETAKCVVWNTYIDNLRNDDDVFNVNDRDTIKNVIKDIADDFDDDWISTFIKQVTTITEYIKKFGGDPSDYKLCRYGESESNNIVSSAYKLFIDKYISVLEGQKDNFDPSDVILYKESETNNIVNALNKYCDNVIENKNNFINNLFKTHLLQGLSLKKIVGKNTCRYEEFNTGDQNVNRIGDVTDFHILRSRTPNCVSVICKGNFKFDDITDEEGNIIKTEHSLKLKLRTFGDGRTGIECFINDSKEPTLGKCPVRIWKPIIGVNDKEDITICIEKFKTMLENKNVKDNLKTIIQYAVKEGPACFPFILLH